MSEVSSHGEASATNFGPKIENIERVDHQGYLDDVYSGRLASAPMNGGMNMAVKGQSFKLGTIH